VIVDETMYRDVTGDTFTDQAKVLRMLARAQARAEEVTERNFDKISRTESLKRKVSCGTKPMFWRKVSSGYSRIGRPSMSREPAVGASIRVSSLASVDLPEPDSPTTASVRPA